MWEARCYSDGIPDEVPSRLTFSGRAPSWKAVAICILKNDHYMQKLGMAPPASKRSKELLQQISSMEDQEIQPRLL